MSDAYYSKYGRRPELVGVSEIISLQLSSDGSEILGLLSLKEHGLIHNQFMMVATRGKPGKYSFIPIDIISDTAYGNLAKDAKFSNIR